MLDAIESTNAAITQKSGGSSVAYWTTLFLSVSRTTSSSNVGLSVTGARYSSSHPKTQHGR
jgi:hypothetical protein